MTKQSTKNKTIKVVIVDDFKLTRIGLKAVLQKYDFINIEAEAENASSIMDYIQNEKPDIILMDLGLPGINGLEATLKIKEISPNTKVIILTAHERSDEVMAAFGAGANAYCLKDIDPYTLSEVIRVVNDGACWIDPAISNVILECFPKPDDLSLLPSFSSFEQKTQLTEREYEVLKLLVEGKSNAEIAKDLIVSVHTAKAHVCSILQKLCVDDRVQAAVKAIKENLI